MARNYRRDAFGRFARVGSTTKVATKSAAKGAARKARQSYVKGSFTKNLEVGRGGDYKGAKIGAEFRTPAGRGVLVKGIVGYHGKPDRRVDVTPSLDTSTKTLKVSAKPNPARLSARSSGVRATPGSAARATPSPPSSAGRKVRR
jgi:hypothetical protein